MFPAFHSRSIVVAFVALAALGFYHAARPGPGTEQQGKVTLRWLLPIDPLKSYYEELARDFEAANPGIHVAITWVPEPQYGIKFRTLAAAGVAPDIFAAGDVGIITMLPFLLDLTPYVQRDAAEFQFDDFYPEVRKAMEEKGRYFFLPATMNLSLAYYNKDLFDQARISYPSADWTWNDFVEAGRKLSLLKGPHGQKVWGNFDTEGWWGEWLIYVRQAGGEIYSKDGARCTLDTPEAIAGLRFYADKIHASKITPSPGYGPENGFQSGLYGTMIGGHTQMWPVFNQVPGLHWDVEMLPIGPAGRAGGEMALTAYGIGKTCAHPEDAWRFLKFLTSPEAMTIGAKLGRLPVRKSVAEKEFISAARTSPPANVAAIYKQIAFARPIPRLADYGEITLDLIQPEIDLMMEGRQTPEQTSARATRAANAFLDTVAKSTGATISP